MIIADFKHAPSDIPVVLEQKSLNEKDIDTPFPRSPIEAEDSTDGRGPPKAPKPNPSHRRPHGDTTSSDQTSLKQRPQLFLRHRQHCRSVIHRRITLAPT
jgi:hypothetical protein